MIDSKLIEVELFYAFDRHNFTYRTHYKNQNQTRLIITAPYECHNMTSTIDVATIIKDEDSAEIRYSEFSDHQKIDSITKFLAKYNADIIFSESSVVIQREDEVLYIIKTIPYQDNLSTLYSTYI